MHESRRGGTPAKGRCTEGGGFEPPRRGLPACRFSRPVHSTALPPFPSATMGKASRSPTGRVRVGQAVIQRPGEYEDAGFHVQLGSLDKAAKSVELRVASLSSDRRIWPRRAPCGGSGSARPGRAKCLSPTSANVLASGLLTVVAVWLSGGITLLLGALLASSSSSSSYSRTTFHRRLGRTQAHWPVLSRTKACLTVTPRWDAIRDNLNDSSSSCCDPADIWP